MSANQNLESFIARIWLERGSNGYPMWRGHVRHVQGEEETYFQNLEAMSNFLEQVSGVTGPSLSGVSLETAKEAKSSPTKKPKKQGKDGDGV